MNPLKPEVNSNAPEGW